MYLNSCNAKLTLVIKVNSIIYHKIAFVNSKFKSFTAKTNYKSETKITTFFIALLL